MRNFMSINVTLLFLVIITIVDASHLFYFPLPKLHSSHHELKSSASVSKSERKSHATKSISQEFIPLSNMERLLYEEEETRDALPQDVFSDEEETVKRLIAVNEVPSAQQKELDYLTALNQGLHQPSAAKTNDDDLDTISSLYGNRGYNGPWVADNAKSKFERLQSDDAALVDSEQRKRRNDTLFLVIVGSCSLVGVLGLVAAAIFWYKIQKRAEAALDSEYPSYGVTGPGVGGSKISPSSTMSDRKLAQSAQMFHYQQQRQQMMAQEKAHLDAKPVHSDDSDDEAPNGGDYTVYECPGLAPTGEMEVRNPLFAEPGSSLPLTALASHPTTNNHYPQPSTSTAAPQEKPTSSSSS